MQSERAVSHRESRRYRGAMTAVEHVAEGQAGGPHPLLRGASPAVICDWLWPGDRARFVDEYQRALDDARRSLDLAELHDVVERGRRLAVMQIDPERFRRTVRRVAEFNTGEPPPADEAFDQTRAKAGF